MQTEKLLNQSLSYLSLCSGCYGIFLKDVCYKAEVAKNSHSLIQKLSPHYTSKWVGLVICKQDLFFARDKEGWFSFHIRLTS